jgi:hypothetical protein
VRKDFLSPKSRTREAGGRAVVKLVEGKRGILDHFCKSGGHSRLRIITGARAGQFWQQDFSQNQQNFDLPGFWIDQQIDSQKDFSQNQQNFDLPGCWIDQQIDSQKYADFSLFRNH